MTVAEAIALLQTKDPNAPFQVCVKVEETGEVHYRAITSISVDEPADDVCVVVANIHWLTAD